jgi:hypothetical protein
MASDRLRTCPVQLERGQVSVNAFAVGHGADFLFNVLRCCALRLGSAAVGQMAEAND